MTSSLSLFCLTSDSVPNKLRGLEVAWWFANSESFQRWKSTKGQTSCHVLKWNFPRQASRFSWSLRSEQNQDTGSYTHLRSWHPTLKSSCVGLSRASTVSFTHFMKLLSRLCLSIFPTGNNSNNSTHNADNKPGWDCHDGANAKAMLWDSRCRQTGHNDVFQCQTATGMSSR